MKRGEELPSAMVLEPLLVERREWRGSGECVNKVDFVCHVEAGQSILEISM